MKTPIILTLLAVVAQSILASPVEKRITIFNGNATIYHPNGTIGACGESFNNSDAVVAISSAIFDGEQCFQKLMAFTHGNDSHTVTGTVVDICDTCATEYDIALSPYLFKQLAPLRERKIAVTFDFPDEL